MLGLLVLFLAAGVLIIVVGSALVLHRITHPPRESYGTMLGRFQPTSPEDIGLNFAERGLRLSDGQITPAWIVEGRKPEGPVVIITHGWARSRYGVLDKVKALAEFTSAIVCYDLRGQGESPANKSHLGTTEVKDLIGILEQLHADQPFVLYGESMGAGISIAAAAARPELVSAVIADAAYWHGMQPIVGFFRENRVPVWPFYLPIGLHMSFWYQQQRHFDRRKHAARLRCPLLLLHGEADPICPLAAARAIAAAAPRSEMVVFEGLGHCSLATHAGTRYLETLERFFASLPAPTQKVVA
jgi:pimeloyl-ACP methyl ester carboxylesterase